VTPPTDPAVDAVEPRGGLPTESKVFLFLGGFSFFLAVVYGVWSSTSPTGIEYAGLIGLLASTLFGVFFGLFLAKDLRQVQADVESAEADAAAGVHDPVNGLYLPETSIWPVGIGVGAALVCAGLGFGWWFILPGLALLVHSLIGFASQSRHRHLD
jgi:hypothetical protein